MRACDEIQGTFALTIEGRGFDSKVSASIGENFFDSECVSCGACVQACPTATLMEKSIIDNVHFMHLEFNTLPEYKKWIPGCQCDYCNLHHKTKVEEYEKIVNNGPKVSL